MRISFNYFCEYLTINRRFSLINEGFEGFAGLSDTLGSVWLKKWNKYECSTLNLTTTHSSFFFSPIGGLTKDFIQMKRILLQNLNRLSFEYDLDIKRYPFITAFDLFQNIYLLNRTIIFLVTIPQLIKESNYCLKTWHCHFKPYCVSFLCFRGKLTETSGFHLGHLANALK